MDVPTSAYKTMFWEHFANGTIKLMLFLIVSWLCDIMEMIKGTFHLIILIIMRSLCILKQLVQ